MISKELAKKIRLLEITTNRAVNDLLAGEYHSVFKGRGMEFDEVREYAPGDEIRTIDWNVTARMGKPFVKRFVEERELTVLFLVDLSASGTFGSQQQLKNEVAAELCALLAFSAIKNNDKVGLIIFSDRVEKFVPPRKGRAHVLRVLRELFYHKPEGRGTDIARALEYLTHVVRRRAVAFLVSDFMSDGFEKPMSVAGRRHDLIAVRLSDQREESLPPLGYVEFEDAETGELFMANTSDSRFRAEFEEGAVKAREGLQRTFRRSCVDVIDIQTDESYVQPLMRFFKERERRFR